MATFALAAQQADTTGIPSVEGIAVKGTASAAEIAAISNILATQLTSGNWAHTDRGNGWTTWVPAPDTMPPPLGKTWDAIRGIKAIAGVETAEPMLLVRQPLTNGSDAQETFQLWGKISRDRLAAIQGASDQGHMHWSLVEMGVLDKNGSRGAWRIWKEKWAEKNPGKTPEEAPLPGTGVVVAHPDTGYTKHPRVLKSIAVDATGKAGKNFVERDAHGNPTDDGLDPMKDQAFLEFPGHGTSTASIIATGNTGTDEPWGVAPGAKILPLRVSSSVIHLSFQNVCDAFDEAMAQKADVISMSLGGPVGSNLLAAKVRAALTQGIIIVSAAGNYAPTVMYPAKLPGVIACAASNALTRPWRFSGMGGETVITAPGELVWHDWSRITGEDAAGVTQFVPDKINGDGTSFATANVAGLAALWLSYHGISYHDATKPLPNGYDAADIPFAFRYCLQESSKKDVDFIRNGGFGRGIALADKLLGIALPDKATVAAIRDEVLSRSDNNIIGAQPSYWWAMITLPTLTLGTDGPPQIAALAAAQRQVGKEPAENALPEDRQKHAIRWTKVMAEASEQDAKAKSAGAETLLHTIVGADYDDTDRSELAMLAASDIGLHNAVARVANDERGAVSPAAVRRYLLNEERPLSQALRTRLQAAQGDARSEWRKQYTSLGQPYAIPAGTDGTSGAYPIKAPTTRRLRAFAFDPSLATRMDLAGVNEITVPVQFERDLLPGPVGEYLEVVDVDPASNCVYAPVDLNHPLLLAQDGLPRSEGNPQFHQQMVYAVAMKTIQHFEEALGRPVFWSPLRPWNKESDDAARATVDIVTAGNGRKRRDLSDQFVRRLRLYPHAMRERNAYYSPQKRAILFGYFPASDEDPGEAFPGGMVFTCLSHDIVAHEMTHAILDGMHVYFTEPTNPDVFAFHEAFADIVALFEHFTYPEVLRDQIGRARGQLDAGTLMTQLGIQFGQATGRHQPLRDAIGAKILQQRTRSENEWRDRREESEVGEGASRQVTIMDAARTLGDSEMRRVWRRYEADPTLIAETEEPHTRGSFLVAAVFDAFLKIYGQRIADLKRIATGGTGILPDGQMHPDLVNRMADEAAKSARHVLRICIRAMDYVPPVDITFGEFLRALITADSDLVPDDKARYRVAFIESFRRWGIYPRDVRTLSEDSLRWKEAVSDGPEQGPVFLYKKEDLGDLEVVRAVRRALLGWQPERRNSSKDSKSLASENEQARREMSDPAAGNRKPMFDAIKAAQATLNRYLRANSAGDSDDKGRRLNDKDAEIILRGIDRTRPFQVTNLRPARRIGPNGEFLTEMVFEVIQNKAGSQQEDADEDSGGGDLPFRGGVTVIVSMDDYRVRYVIHKGVDSASREARQQEYAFRAKGSDSSGAAEYSSANLPADWKKTRASEREAMRASSCDCRAEDLNAGKKPSEPFAMLHRE